MSPSLTRVLLLNVFCVISVYSWEKYAKPLRAAWPNEKGVYEFNLELKSEMTMTRNDSRKRQIVEYDPNTKLWLHRAKESPPSRRLLNESQLSSVVVGDGLHKFKIFINGESPGPNIVVPFGAKVLLRVKNWLHEEVTLHIHGMRKVNKWYTDGVPYIQQCPIAPSTSYTYSFIADTLGTHWYHGHSNLDRVKGLLGGFVVVKPNSRAALREYMVLVQDEPVLSIDEHFYMAKHGLQGIYKCGRTYDNSHTGSCYPIQSITVNGKGWYDQKELKKRPELLPLETFQIKRGEKIRLRLVNGGAFHGLMVTVDKLIFYPGERYNVILKGMMRPVKKNYRIVIETLDHHNEEMVNIDPTYGLAILEYQDVTTNTKLGHYPGCLSESNCIVLNCPFAQFPQDYPYRCISADQLESAEISEDSEILNTKEFTNNFEEYFYNTASRNGFTFKLPTSIPYHNQHRMGEVATACDSTCPLKDRKDIKGFNCACFFTYNFTLNNIIQMTFYNMDGRGDYTAESAHPIHLHGHQFYVMKIGHPYYNAEGHIIHHNMDIPCTFDTAPCSNLSFSNPHWMSGNVDGIQKYPSLRDTVVVPAGGYVVIRFRANNPGWWLAHCHMIFHAKSGLGFAFKVGENSEIPSPPEGFPQGCGNYAYKEF
ncbi:hypothetical protein QR680_004312 [Steinernema hermaphroditum]|uniref:Uncharacterized protein n=1 Tax=Steinernema hermaphroditum TaxID=289476 RepID=A0AA39LTG7_9BILA|nr:hypothetical protein QR680_004312 [Steinernema hermaphroditum]